MNTVFALFSLLTLFIAALIFTRMLRLRTPLEFLIAFPMLFATLIVLLGYLLSAMSRLDQLLPWSLLSLLALIEALLPLLFYPELRAHCLRKPEIPRAIEAHLRVVNFRSYSSILLLGIGGVLCITAVVNLIVLMTLPPSTPDVFDYHLARMAYYLQQGSLRYFDAQYWAQVIYPKVATVLHLYTYLVAERIDMLTQFVQYLAYGVTLFAAYGICRLLHAGRRAACFAAAVFGLLPIALMQAATAQNDMILTAFLGANLFYLLCYRETRHAKYLALAALAFALAAGVKATIVPLLPSLGLVAIYLLFTRMPAETPRPQGRPLALGAVFLALSLLIVTLPSGYGENLLRFGDPFGPLSVREHYTHERVAPLTMLRNGGLNVLRYSVDFFRLDGAVPWPYALEVQRAMTAVPRVVFSKMGIDLESARATRPHFPFQYQQSIIADATRSSWGQVGFMIIWPMLIFALLNKRREKATVVFTLAFLVYVLVLCFAVPYDAFHGRFFASGALFALPAVAAGFTRWQHSRIARGYLVFASLLMCLFALSAVSFRSGTPLFPVRYKGQKIPSVYSIDPNHLPLREMPSVTLVWYETMVPSDAVVAIDTRYVASEYLFFGQGLTRRLIPLQNFLGERKAIPADASWLIYDRFSPHYQPDGYIIMKAIAPRPELYLRALK